MLTELVNFLANARRELQEQIFDTPPKTLEDLNLKVGEYRAFSDVLDKIEAMQRSAEEKEARS